MARPRIIHRVPPRRTINTSSNRTMEEWGKLISEWLGISAKLAGGFGLLIIILYCYFIINFTPAGLTLADTFFYAAISFGFGFLFIAFAALSTFSLCWLFEPMLEHKWNFLSFNIFLIATSILALYILLPFPSINILELWDNWALLICAIGTLVVIGTIYFLYKIRPSLLAALGIVRGCCAAFLTRGFWCAKRRMPKFIVGMFTYIPSILVFIITLTISLGALNKYSWEALGEFWRVVILSSAIWLFAISLANKNSKVAGKKGGGSVLLLTIIFGLFIPFTSKQFSTGMIEITFEKFGIRQSNVIAILNAENAAKLHAVIPSSSTTLTPCRTEKEAIAVIYGANLLWHGLGEKSLVEIPLSPFQELTGLDKKNIITIDLDRKGITIVKTPKVQMCFELPSTAFETGKHVLLKKKSEELKKGLNELKSRGVKIDYAEIVGFSDNRPITGGNQGLSEKRAKSVADLLAALGINEDNVKYFGKGVEAPKTICQKGLSTVELDECLAPNRRAEIRLTLTRQ